MNIIKPAIIHHTIKGQNIGPAAPTPAEDKLREEFTSLENHLREIEAEIHAKIKAKEAGLLQEIQAAHVLVQEAHERLKVLESHWYVKLVNWFRKVLSWL